jgi:hypothetical protein
MFCDGKRASTRELQWCGVCLREMYGDKDFYWTVALTKLTVSEHLAVGKYAQKWSVY